MPVVPANPSQRYPRPLYLVLGSLFFLYVVLVMLTIVFESNIVFPAPLHFGRATPQNLNLPYEDLQIPVDAKTHLHGWWIPAHEPTDRVLLYFHGNAQTLETSLDELAIFQHLDTNVLMVDYRGYGTSSALSPTGVTTAADARSALDYLRKRNIPLSSVILFGRSIGTGVATQLATEQPGLGGLVLLTPITSTDDVGNQLIIFRYFLRPGQWFRHDTDFRNDFLIRQVHPPMLLLAGTKDTVAPPWMARELYANATGTKTLQMIQGADHNNIILPPHDAEILQALQAFLTSLPASAPKP